MTMTEPEGAWISETKVTKREMWNTGNSQRQSAKAIKL